MKQKIHPPELSEPLKAVQQLAKDLRHPETGCPWDVEQDHQSTAKHLVEETYEVVDAIEDLKSSGGSPSAYRNLKEELGDLFFQIVFHCQLADEKNEFTLNDVALAITEKLIFRHPHVYQDDSAQATDSNQVLQNWEQLKRQEREKKSQDQSILAGVPKSMPALQKAFRLGQKVARINFDWPDTEAGIKQIHDKILEELAEVKEELPEHTSDFEKSSPQKKRAELEIGDLLFAVSQLARKYHINPEEALQKANQKFTRRFTRIESGFQKRINAKDIPSLEEWQTHWHVVKKDESSF